MKSYGVATISHETTVYAMFDTQQGAIDHAKECSLASSGAFGPYGVFGEFPSPKLLVILYEGAEYRLWKEAE
jgi:hypothetical protein